MKFVKEQINLNSFLLAILVALSGWLGNRLYDEVRTTHDAVLRMVPRDEFNLEITSIKVRLTALEWEVKQARKGTQ